MSTPSLSQLKRAVEISEQVEKLQSEIIAIFAGQSAPAKASPSSTPRQKTKRTLSAATIAKMRTAQQARWAKKSVTDSPLDSVSLQAAKPAKAKKPKAKRNISPEARAKMAEAARKRWAKAKKS